MIWEMQIVGTNHPFLVTKQLKYIKGFAVIVRGNVDICIIARSHVAAAIKVRTISNMYSGK